jgi:hypothetical protein
LLPESAPPILSDLPNQIQPGHSPSKAVRKRLPDPTSAHPPAPTMCVGPSIQNAAQKPDHYKTEYPVKTRIIGQPVTATPNKPHTTQQTREEPQTPENASPRKHSSSSTTSLRSPPSTSLLVSSILLIF